jgi:single-strand DNA-binding protein
MATNKSNGKSKRSNYVILTLQATSDGEVKVSAAGKPWGSLRAFFSQGKDEKSGEFRPSMWFTVKAFGKTDQIEGVVAALQNVATGNKVTVKGRLSMEEWDDKDGNKRQSWIIITSSIEPFVETAEAEAELEGEPA